MRCPKCFEEHYIRFQCGRCGYKEGERLDGPNLPIGTSLRQGEYIIGKVLGKPGGFGITYLAWDTRLDIRVAIKEYIPLQKAGRSKVSQEVTLHSPEYREDFDKGLEDFLGEAKTLAQFRHPNIVRVSNFFRENATAYMVMDFLDGQNLMEYISKTGKITGPDAVGLLLPLLDGLSHMHQRGVIHRDIKPTNIYLTEEGQVVLLDFGTARQALRDRSQSMTAFCSSGFTPPEQYHRKGKQGTWTDVYACAATLYLMIAGQLPPDGSERTFEDDLVPIRHLIPGLDQEIAAAIMKGLAVKIEERPQTADELKQMLQKSAFVDNESAMSQEDYLHRAHKLFIRSQHAEAVDDYIRVIKINSNNQFGWEALINLGESYWHLGQYEKAIATLTDAFKIFSHGSDLLFRGMSYASLNHHAEAIADFTRAIEENPDWTIVFYHRGRSFDSIGRVREAIEDFNKYLVLSQNEDKNWDATSVKSKENSKENSKEQYARGYIANYNRKITQNKREPNKVNVLLRNPEETKEQEATLPTDVVIHRIVAKIVKMMGLPTSYDDGTPLVFKLYYKALGEELKGNQTLAEANVKDGDVLVLVPAKATASGSVKPQPFIDNSPAAPPSKKEKSKAESAKKKTGFISKGTLEGLLFLAVAATIVYSSFFAGGNSPMTLPAKAPVAEPTILPKEATVKFLSGHTATVNSVSFSPDGKTLASGSDDKTVRLWDVASGREVQKLSGQNAYVNSVVFSPDGKTVVSGMTVVSGIRDITVCLWDVASGREVQKISGSSNSVLSVAFSPDGKTVASGSFDNMALLWDGASGREVQRMSGHTATVNSVSFSPDGKTVASGSDDKTVRLWDVASGREVQKMSGMHSTVNSVSFSPDGKTVASGSSDNRVRLWDISSLTK